MRLTELTPNVTGFYSLSDYMEYRLALSPRKFEGIKCIWNRTILLSNRHYLEVMSVQLKIVFKSIEKEKSLEKIIEELIDDTIRKVLVNHPGISYNRETAKDRLS